MTAILPLYQLLQELNKTSPNDGISQSKAIMKVIIYEDDDKLRHSLSLLIDGSEGFDVIGAFTNCAEVESHVHGLKPDVILMDIDMPGVDGMEGVNRVKSINVDIKILMHTVFDDNERLFNCLKLGADGYILKKTSPVELLAALRDIYSGGAPMSPGIAKKVIATFRKNEGVQNNYGLTPRQLEILQLLANGHTYKSISAECGITEDTVATHLRNIYEKLHVNCATEAVAKAIRERIVK